MDSKPGQADGLKTSLHDLLGPELAATGDVLAWKYDSDSPPLFIEPTTTELQDLDAFVSWVKAHRPALDALLIRHGAVVFRGFPVASAADFDRFVSQYEPFAGNYSGGATPREKIVGKVYQATQLACELKLPLHQEMAYVARGPRRVVFFCKQPAEQGGETTIADMRRVTRELPEALRQRLAAHGILGVRNFEPVPGDGVEKAVDHPDMRSWKFGFYTESKEEVEAECRAKQMEPIWREDGGLTVRNHIPAFARHPVTGETVYRNTLHTNGGRDLAQSLDPERRARVEEMLARQPTKSGFYVGDGSELSAEELKQLQTLFDTCELAWSWRKGDVMLLDNLLTAHGRKPYAGARDVQVAMLD